MKPILLLALGLFLGFYMVIFLPFLFVVWLESFIVEAREPVRCDAGNEAEPLEDAPLPGVFQRRLDGKGLR